MSAGITRKPEARRSTFEDAVEGWRTTRHPRFAALAELIAGREAARPALGATGQRKDKEAWNALAEAGDWRDFARLVATLPVVVSPLAADRVRVLAGRDDPRLIPQLLAILADPPYTSGTSKRFWQAVVAALEASGDVRARDGMRDLSMRYKTINDTHLGAWLAGAMYRAASRMPEAPVLTEEVEAELAAFEAAVGAPTPAPPAKRSASHDDLFAEIIAAPDDDAARLVYADLVAERDALRCELIILQIDRAAGRGTPERADLERKRFTGSLLWKEWATPIATAADGITFERGFPAIVKLGLTGLARVVDSVAWGTVHTLAQAHRAAVSAVVALLNGERARNVLHVDGLDPRIIDRLDAELLPWTKLGIARGGLRGEHLARLPHLTDLTIDDGSPFTPALFAAAPGLRAATLRRPTADAGAHLFARTPKLGSLALGSAMQPERFAGLAVRALSVRAECAEADAWLRAIPSIRTLDLLTRTLDWSALLALFEGHPDLEGVTATRYHGYLCVQLSRTPEGVVLTVPPLDRSAKDEGELVASAPLLRGAGVRELVLCPRGPRHLVAPMSGPDLDALRRAWGDRLTLREVL